MADPEADELSRLRAEILAFRSEAVGLHAMVDLATAIIERDSALMNEVVAERAELEMAGSVLCATVFDIERANYETRGKATCAWCGKVDLRKGDEMRAHAEACDKHPMAALRAEVANLKSRLATAQEAWRLEHRGALIIESERDSQATLAAGYKRERDFANAELARVILERQAARAELADARANSVESSAAAYAHSATETREACAKVADGWDGNIGASIAAAMRSRGGK